MVRVSRVGDRGDDLLSPEIQRKSIEQWADRRGATIVDWVEALDESASSSRSPWWNRLDAQIARIEAGELDTIVVWKLSRAARHRRRWAVAVDRVEVAGGRLESATEDFDSSTSSGRLTRGMLAELAAWEADLRSEGWKEAHAHRRARGLPHSGRPRFGYHYDKGTGYQPDPETGPILAELYRRAVDGEGGLALARYLNARGVPSATGIRWRDSRVRELLASGFGAGLIWQPSVGDWYQGAHPAVISRELWEAYLRRREQVRGTPPRLRAPVHPLSGLLRCGECGGPMNVDPRRLQDGRKVIGFRCVAWHNQRSCVGTHCSGEAAEAAVLDWLRPLADDVEANTAAAAGRRAEASRVKVDVTRMVRERDKLEESLGRLAALLATGDIDPGPYRLAREELNGRLADVTAELGKLMAAEQDLSSEVPAARVRELLFEWPSMTAGDRRSFLAELIDRVVVHRGQIPPGGKRARPATFEVIGIWAEGNWP